MEVKSGSSGKLKSLHWFMDTASHQWAVRVSSAKMQLEEATTPDGKKFSLISIPFYLTGRIGKVLEDIIK